MKKDSKNIFKKLLISTALALTATAAYAGCTTHTACHEGKCITVKVCIPDPVFTPDP